MRNFLSNLIKIFEFCPFIRHSCGSRNPESYWKKKVLDTRFRGYDGLGV